MGVRSANVELALGFDDGQGFEGVAEVCRLRLGDVAEGVVMGIPMDPHQLLEDQERALARMERAVALAGRLDAVGLGSLCAVVAGRGQGLAERVTPPVTTGAAATAWALWRNTHTLLEAQPGACVAIVGSAGPVGSAVAALLRSDGVSVRVDHARTARRLGLEKLAGVEEAVAGAQIVVGAGPTGASLPAEAVRPGAVLIDVAIPDTLVGRPAPGVRVFAGEAVVPPAEWHAGGWGRVYQVLAGYGPTQVYACLIEPLVVAVDGRSEPYAQGRRLKPDTVLAFGEAAEALGFRPRLARGWRGVPGRQLGGRRRRRDRLRAALVRGRGHG